MLAQKYLLLLLYISMLGIYYNFKTYYKNQTYNSIPNINNNIPNKNQRLNTYRTGNSRGFYVSSGRPRRTHNTVPPYPKFQLLQSNILFNSTMFFLGEYNYFTNDARMKEVKHAMRETAKFNPRGHFIVLVSETDQNILHTKLLHDIKHISYEVYYTAEILYGTLFEIGNHYVGVKFAGSADDIYPPVNFNCSFRNPRTMYALSRRDSESESCTRFSGQGSFDGFMFEHVNKQAISDLKFSRAYYGCENVAAHVLEQRFV